MSHCSLLGGCGDPCTPPGQWELYEAEYGRPCPRIEPFAANRRAVAAALEVWNDETDTAADILRDAGRDLSPDERTELRRKVNTYLRELKRQMASSFAD